MNYDLKCILSFLQSSRNLDFSGYRESMVERRINRRFALTKTQDPVEYLCYLREHPDETDNLIDSLTINVSRFFRDSLTFEYIAGRILPAIIHQKNEARDQSLRVWSAGCAMGEESYSAAILIHEFLKKEARDVAVNIFATDIDGNTLNKAQKGIYPSESIQNVKYRLLKKYFTREKEMFCLTPVIKEMVSFSVYDMLDKKSYSPPESIFGDFDLVLCRNVLIYFNAGHQDLIFKKLYRALAKNGFLVLGEAEVPSATYQKYFRKMNDCCHIYQKI